MAKKSINLILISVVLGLWGTVGYRALNGPIFGDSTVGEKHSQENNMKINQINKDTFKLEKLHWDPFLNKQYEIAPTVSKRIITKQQRLKKVVVPTKPDPNLKWPALSYYGYIRSRNQELVLLKVDSKLCKLKVNDAVNGLVVKKMHTDSIEVSFNFESKTIKLK
jgi:hypothetical protein